MPRYLVTTRRSLRDSAMTALAAAESEEGVEVVNGHDPHMVTIDTSDARATDLANRLKDTHTVEPEIRRGLL